MNNNKIIFYIMEGCGYCGAAKETLKNEIKNGTVVVQPQSKAPPGVRGFPHFTHKDKSYSGAPKSFKILKDKLGYEPNKSKENYDGWIGVTSNREMYSDTDNNKAWVGVM
jgi:glutaredoxin